MTGPSASGAVHPAGRARTVRRSADSGTVTTVSSDADSPTLVTEARTWKSSPRPIEDSGADRQVRVSTSTSSSGSPAISTVKVRLAVGLTWPAASVARTSKVCSPTGRSRTSWGDVQSSHGPSSTRHSKVAGSSASNSKVTSSVVTVPDRSGGDGDRRAR